MEVSHNGKVVNSGESIAIGDSGRVTLGLAPNFNMDMLSINAPKWIKLEREKKNLILNVVEDSLKYTINREDDSLRLFKDSTFYCSLHVQYAGMNPNKIHIDGQLNSLVVLQDAICVYVENGSWGATYGVPIGALMMEQYINGHLSPESEAKAELFYNKHLYTPQSYAKTTKP